MSVVIFVCRLVEQSTGLAPVAPLLKSYAKVEKLSISELNDFVLTAASQVCYHNCDTLYRNLTKFVRNVPMQLGR